ncbi:phosphatase PAP2 family protein [Nocardia sp. alder85J]|uniref:phosphatase PAP2 family protein n=1 Tax=Nocardia sp. alder85J TaxID=2862949 RepID=UPI001CD4CDD8|nr:phosphatase PAP2 family protein [Nocardia sp. alder85J]MCX4091124.1 phosphatase PAP2 family protein [Nocardia sp. alder85J]
MVVSIRSFLSRYRAHLAEIGLILLLYVAYDGTRFLIRGGTDAAELDAHTVQRVEDWLRLRPEHWLNDLFTAHFWLGVPADYLYATLHYVVTGAVLIWLWRAHRPAYRHGRTQLALATVTGLAGFIFFPTAPPRLLSDGGYIDVMSQHAAVGWWADNASAPRGLGSLTNEFAAMPSLHVGWAVWCGLMVFRHARPHWVRALGAAYPVVIMLVVMGTANHYLLDGIVGTALMLLAGWVATPYLRGFDAAASSLRTPPTRVTRRAPATPLPAPAFGAPRPAPAPAPAAAAVLGPVPIPVPASLAATGPAHIPALADLAAAGLRSAGGMILIPPLGPQPQPRSA